MGSINKLFRDIKRAKRFNREVTQQFDPNTGLLSDVGLSKATDGSASKNKLIRGASQGFLDKHRLAVESLPPVGFAASAGYDPRKKRGRKSLRIDLAGPSSSPGTGLNIPL